MSVFFLLGMSAMLASQHVVVAVGLNNCVFLHGAGTHSTAADSGEDDTSYWGGTAKLIQNTPACAERVLWHQDTRTRRWDDSDLIKAACSAATTFSIDDKTITNTTVYAHSVSRHVLRSVHHFRGC